MEHVFEVPVTQDHINRGCPEANGQVVTDDVNAPSPIRLACQDEGMSSVHDKKYHIVDCCGSFVDIYRGLAGYVEMSKKAMKGVGTVGTLLFNEKDYTVDFIPA